MGYFFASASSAARVTFSPTTAPIDPPINLNSIEQQITGRPSSFPSAVSIASLTPSFLRASWMRCLYGLVSVKPSGSVETSSASCSSQSPSSSSNSSRRFARIRKWKLHFGQTSQLASRSFFQMIERQASHLVHRPSVRTRRSSFGVGFSIGFFSRLNQAINFSWTQPVFPGATR